MAQPSAACQPLPALLRGAPARHRSSPATQATKLTFVTFWSSPSGNQHCLVDDEILKLRMHRDIRPGVQAQAACQPEQCGNMTVSSPFGIISGSEENRCAQLGFQDDCIDGVPYLGYYEAGFGLQIRNIFYNNGSLLVSDVHKLRDFNLSSERGCHVPKANTTTKTGYPFSVSPLNQNLVFYNCTRAPAAQAGLVDMVCRNNTFVRAGGLHNVSGRIDRGYTLPGCNATAMPVFGATGKVNASNYQELISDGFLLT